MKEGSEKNQVREDGPAKKAKKVAGEIGEKPEKCGHRSQQKSVSRRRRCSGPLKCCSEMSRKVAPCPPHLSSGSLLSKAFPDHLLQRALPPGYSLSILPVDFSPEHLLLSKVTLFTCLFICLLTSPTDYKFHKVKALLVLLLPHPQHLHARHTVLLNKAAAS